MSATTAEVSLRQEPEEVATAAFRLASDGRISHAYPWQATVYERLSNPENDAGYLLLTPGAGGKTEAVLVPSVGLQRGGGPRRVFIIGADGSPLDDYVLRVSPYLTAWAAADDTPRTLYVDGDHQLDQDGNAVRFLADGRTEAGIAISPLEADVDVVLTTFSSFLDLFFGSGGVHGLPSSLPLLDDDEFRRDLFFFDEAHSYASVPFSQFLRLVEYLFAEDTDIVVASSTMPPGFEEELSFLEKVVVPAEPRPVKLEYRPTDDSISAIITEAKKLGASKQRTAIVLETPTQADVLVDTLPAELRQSAITYLPGANAEQRRKNYGSLAETSEPFLLITVGSYFETSDLDVDCVLSTLCLPESLILRAGRCNRFGRRSEGRLAVFGDSLDGVRRKLNNAQQTAYFEALNEVHGPMFDPNAWKRFI